MAKSFMVKAQRLRGNTLNIACVSSVPTQYPEFKVTIIRVDLELVLFSLMSATNVGGESDKDPAGVETSSDKLCLSRKAAFAYFGPMLASRPNVEHLVCVEMRVAGLSLSGEAEVEEGLSLALGRTQCPWRCMVLIPA